MASEAQAKAQALPQEPPDFSGFTPAAILKEVDDILKDSSRLQDHLVATISIREATFANVVRPLVDNWNRAKYRQQILSKVLVAASPDADLREASREAQKLILAAESCAYMRADVAALVTAVFELSQKDHNDDGGGGQGELDTEDRYLLERMYNEYRRSGAGLTDLAQRARLQAVRAELDDLRLAAQKTLTDVRDGLWFNRSELSGIAGATLSNLEFERSASGEDIEDQFWVPLHGAVANQIMQNASQGKTRQKLSMAISQRFPENIERLEKIIILRQEAAELLGFVDHASLRMGEKMAESVTEVESLLQEIRRKAEPYAAKEIERLLQLKEKDINSDSTSMSNGVKDQSSLFSWDWAFYSQKLRWERYSFDASTIREYFEAKNTFREMLKIFTRLFSIEFVPIQSSVWHESVFVVTVWDTADSGAFLGYLYVDLFTRDGKYRNAQHIPINRGFTEADGTRHYPCSALMLDLPAPGPERPTLLLMSQIRTMFHEMGHAIHNLCSQTKYGIAHSRDFVEIPSLMLEHWIWDPEVLTKIGMHYTYLEKSESSVVWEDGANHGTIPRDLVMAVCRTKNLHKAHEILLEVQRAIFDLVIHTPRDATKAKEMDTTLLWNTTRRDIVGLPLGLSTEQLGFAQAAFGHIFRAYDAGFFAYPLSKVYAADLYNTIFKNDPLNPSIGRRYRYGVLRKGSGESEMKTLEGFLGRKPNAQSFNSDLASAWT